MVSAVVGRTRELDTLERRLRAGGAAVLHGPGGSGRTGLAKEIRRRWERSGGHVHWCPGDAGAELLPFGLLLRLGAEGTAPGDVAAVRATLAAQARHRPTLLVVDDAHLLDAGSLLVLRQLAALPGVSALLTVRNDVTVPAGVTVLWKDDGALRMELDWLDRAASNEVLASAAGGPFDAESAQTLAELAQGRPLLLRELVTAARDENLLRREDGRWHLTRAPTVTPRIVELAGQGLAQLDEGRRRALEALCVAGELPLAVMLDLVGMEVSEWLEERGAVVVDDTTPGRPVSLAHPIAATLVRAAATHTRLVRLARELLERYGQDGSDPRIDSPLALAALWERAGYGGRPALFVEAAQAALAADDARRACDLAAGAVARGGGPAALRLRGQALHALGHGDEAEDVLARAASEAGTDEDVTAIALLRFANDLFVRDAPHEALDALERARAEVTDPHARDSLDAALALDAVFRGDMSAALTACEQVLARTSARRVTVLDVVIVATIAHTLLGDVGAGAADSDRAVALAQEYRAERPLARDQTGLNQVMVLMESARLEEAAAAARAGLAAAQAEEASPHVGTWAAALAWVQAEQGRCGAALESATQALRHLEVGDPLRLRGLALTVSARCAAGAGDVVTARRLLGEAGPLRGDLRTDSLARRAEVWVVAADGELGRAAELAVAHAAHVEQSHPVWAAALLHDAVRVGAPEAALPRLASLAADHDAPLMHLRLRHARALAGADVTGLETLAHDLATAGLPLYAAEAAAQAADLARRAGHAREGARANALAAEHVGDLGGVATPALLSTRDPLTTREREVALMARAGASSRQIAERLVLSVRTVDNYLAAVYRKTGARGRQDLATVLAAVKGR